MEYDYSKINDKDFEILFCDLLSEEIGVRVERFKPGKDKGVDGRYFSANEEVIIQCKHYLKSGYSKLRSVVATEEIEKVKILKPKKYIFATSLPLSRANKTEIKNIFDPYIKSDTDIYGLEDIDYLLGKYPNILKKHYKLWFTSTTVLMDLLNNAIVGRSRYELERITKNTDKYVETEYYHKTIKLLEKQRSVIISGEPGIGKTTLSENICLYYVSKGFEFYVIENSLNEAEAVYESNKKQIFLFDDFLGSNYLEAIENKKDSHILKFITRVKNDSYKRFILTSRSNILNYGIRHSSYFQVANLTRDNLVLDVTGISQIDKARILYNHIWFSKLEEDYIQKFYDDSNYLKVINHRNYNPRLINFITNESTLPLDDSSMYWDYIISCLKNPRDIWDDCFKRQSNEYVRNIALLCVYNGGEISERGLISAYEKICEIEQMVNPSHTSKDFDSMIRLAVGSFINRNIYNSATYYSLYNPSIADYVINTFSNNATKLFAIYEALETDVSIKKLIDLRRQGIISSDIYEGIINRLYPIALEISISSEWARLILLEHIEIFGSDKKSLDFTKLQMRNFDYNQNMVSISMLINRHIEALESELQDFVYHATQKSSLDSLEIQYLAGFIIGIDDNDEVIELFTEQISQYLEEQLDTASKDIDISSYVKEYHSYDGQYEYEFEKDRFRDKLIEIGYETISDSNCSFVDDLIDFNSIIDSLDIDSLYDSYMQHDPDDYDRPFYSTSNSIEDIHDLFERS